MTRKQKRLTSIGAILGVIACAVGLVLSAVSDGIAYFNSPTDLVTKTPGPSQRIRLGGLVEKGSLDRGAASTVRFRVTDSVESVVVVYEGILPDLFREEQGIVAEGTLGPDHVFVADTVLAKHDETYMPKEVVDDLKKRGLWEDGKPKAASNTMQPAPMPVSTGAGS